MSPLTALGVVGGFLGLISLILAFGVRIEPASGIELAIRAQIQSIGLPGTAEYMEIVSLLTGTYTRYVVIPAAIMMLWLKGHRRPARAVLIGSLVVGSVAMVGDFGLGQMVGRVRPFTGATELSFPSAHTYGTVLFFGVLAFLVHKHGLPRKYGIPVLGILAVLTVSVGPSRIFLNMHWPADVIAGYLYGAAALIFFIATYSRMVQTPTAVEPEELPTGN